MQRATRDSLTPEQTATLTRTAADALLQAWPDIERDSALGQALRDCTIVLQQNGGDFLWHPDVHPVLRRAGQSIGEAGDASAAVTYWQRLYAEATKRLGPDHMDTLDARSEMAYWRGQAGDQAGAANAFEALLAHLQRVVGPDHPLTLTAWGNLAYWREETGDLAGAGAVLESLLADRLRVLGPDHADTLATRHNLAWWRGDAGDPAGAVAGLEALLADSLRVLGPDDPFTLSTRGNLAHWRGGAGIQLALQPHLRHCSKIGFGSSGKIIPTPSRPAAT